MKFRRSAWLLLMLAVPLLTLACGGGDDRLPTPVDQEPSPEDEGLPAELSAEVVLLGSMVFTADEVGEALPRLAPILEISRDLVFNEDEVARADDPDDTRADIENFGRLVGYEASYLPEEGPEEVLVVVGLYETAEGASGFLKEMLEDPETFGALDEFDVGEIGDEANGRTGELILGVPATGILLRVDRVFAIVTVSLSEEDVRDEVGQFARKLAERIEAAIQGQVVPLP